VHWIIGDPIGVAYGGATWRVMFEKIIGLLIKCPASYQVSLLCPHPGIATADIVAKDDFRRWIAGKRYIPQQKSPMKDKSVGCPLGDGNGVGIAEHFP